MNSPWRVLEEFPGLSTYSEIWQARLGPEFAAMAALCLDPADWLAISYPCPHHCGCSHHVIPRHDGEGGVAVCRCDPAVCDDIPLTRAQITPLEINFAKLGRALCQVFGLASKFVALPPEDTFQIGAWSADAVPAILTIQVKPDHFRGIVAELTSTLRRPFILFAPTSTHLDAPCRAMLENHSAEFFALDAHLVITGPDTLQARCAPGELFIRFNPQPKECGGQSDAVVEQLGLPTYQVFQLYCKQALSARETARRLGCSKTTVLRQLNKIRAKTGKDPKYFRPFSAQFARMEPTFSDPRAARIQRWRLA